MLRADLSGEDPFLGAALAPEAVQGIQSKGVIANAKHWVDNSQETNRTTNIAVVDERTQMEIYCESYQFKFSSSRVLSGVVGWAADPPFAAAVKAGVGSIMCR